MMNATTLTSLRPEASTLLLGGALMATMAMTALAHFLFHDTSTWTAASGVPATDAVALYTPKQIRDGALACGRAECDRSTASTTGASCCTHYAQLLSFLEDFLGKPHDQVGRKGPVCPFVPLSLKKQTIMVGMIPTSSDTFEVTDVVTLMREQRDHFMKIAPTTGPMRLYKALVFGFPGIPDEDAPRYIDDVQRQLKSEFTRCGMMIGEFHRHNMTAGLRNPAFHPLQTPIPALAMRYMVPTDILFLEHDPELITAYLNTIPDSPANEQFRQQAQAALDAFDCDSIKTTI